MRTKRPDPFCLCQGPAFLLHGPPSFVPFLAPQINLQFSPHFQPWKNVYGSASRKQKPLGFLFCVCSSSKIVNNDSIVRAARKIFLPEKEIDQWHCSNLIYVRQKWERSPFITSLTSEWQDYRDDWMSINPNKGVGDRRNNSCKIKYHKLGNKNFNEKQNGLPWSSLFQVLKLIRRLSELSQEKVSTNSSWRLWGQKVKIEAQYSCKFVLGSSQSRKSAVRAHI